MSFCPVELPGVGAPAPVDRLALAVFEPRSFAEDGESAAALTGEFR